MKVPSYPNSDVNPRHSTPHHDFSNPKFEKYGEFHSLGLRVRYSFENQNRLFPSTEPLFEEMAKAVRKRREVAAREAK